MPLSALKLLLLCCVLKNACVLINFLCPVYELLLVEDLWRKVDGLFERALVELGLEPHVNYKSNIFVIVHICALL